MAAAQLSIQDQVLFVTGSIGFDNAPALYNQGLKLLQQHQHGSVVVDLSELSLSNTVALAVFVQWLRQCKVGQGFYLQNVPQKMQAIIQASNLADALYPDPAS